MIDGLLSSLMTLLAEGKSAVSKWVVTPTLVCFREFLLTSKNYEWTNAFTAALKTAGK